MIDFNSKALGDDIWFERLFRWSLLFYLLHVIYAVISSRFLFADGAWFFLKLLLNEQYVSGSRPARFLADILTQTPLLVSVKLGLSNLTALKWIYGASLFFPYLVCILTWHQSTKTVPQHRAFLLAFLFMSAMNSDFFIISESHFSAAIFFAQLPLIVLRTFSERKSLSLIAPLALVSIATYESMILYGPILFMLSVIRAYKYQENSSRRAWLYLSCCYLVVFAFALKEVIWPMNPELTSTHFLHQIIILTRHNMFGFLFGESALHFGLLFSFIGSVLTILTYFFVNRFATLMKYTVIGFGTMVLAVAILLALFPAQIGVNYHYRARVIQIAVPIIIAGFFFAMAVQWIRIPRAWWPYFVSILAIIGAYQFFWQALATQQWNGYLKVYRKEVSQHRGVVYIEDSILSKRHIGRQALKMMNWSWTHPVMSVLVGANEINAIISKRGQTWPFDPTDAADLPQLTRYHVDLNAYKKGLGNVSSSNRKKERK